MTHMRTPRRTDIGDFIAANVIAHPSHIVALVAANFQISRSRAYEHVSREVREGRLIKSGTTKAAKYFLSMGDVLEFGINIDPGLAEDKVWSEYVKPKLSAYPKNIYDICHYGFTEIFNNAIDHSEGSRIHCWIKIQDGKIGIRIMDNGVGIFHKIQKALHLSSMKEAVLHLSKGKFTTDPTRHSGQGIFFTSRVFDTFSILSSNLFYLFQENDWLVSDERDGNEKGTLVRMEIDVSSSRTAKQIMDQYATNDTEVGFHKTIVSVQLSSDDNDPHISRSQAKRLLMGLDRFRHIVLDFKNVKAVGQAFVDEVFRVFKNEHPSIKITYVHASPDVEFMIKRGVASD